MSGIDWNAKRLIVKMLTVGDDARGEECWRRGPDAAGDSVLDPVPIPAHYTRVPRARSPVGRPTGGPPTEPV
jgi:hypothetical protein